MRLRSSKRRILILSSLTVLVVIFIIRGCLQNVATWFPKLLTYDRDIRILKQVAADGETVVVSGEGKYSFVERGKQVTKERSTASVYVRSGSTWVRQAQLVSADYPEDMSFAENLDISGDTVVVTGESSDPASKDYDSFKSVYVFQYVGSQWVQQAKLLANGISNDLKFARDVAIDGNTILVGDRGAVHVFERNPSTGKWSYSTKLVAPKDIELQIDALTQVRGATLGSKVAIDGNTIVVSGTVFNSEKSVPQSFVFVRDAATNDWKYQTSLAPGSSDGYGCGSEESGTVSGIAVDGDTIVTACPGETIWHSDAMGPIGAIYVFTRNPATGTWTQQARVEPQGVYRGRFWEWTRFLEYYGFGAEVDLKGDSMIVSASRDMSRVFGSNDSAVYLYKRDPKKGNWIQQAKILANSKGVEPDPTYGNRHVAISESYAAVGVSIVFPENSRNLTGAFYTFDLKVSPR
jgi:hypothetical protein